GLAGHDDSLALPEHHRIGSIDRIVGRVRDADRRTGRGGRRDLGGRSRAEGQDGASDICYAGDETDRPTGVDVMIVR
ncbi:hypothetical protein MKK64_26400, partial [Methylobacterium sp. E-025]|uniref:hypothetical protein n=1 Tax=Methylobacterium sp. E-025 TaxID=2836561 RepID=UPI001FBBD7D0